MFNLFAAFDAALWRVNGEMAQDPLLLELLHYACAWFDPDAHYCAPMEQIDASPVVMSQFPAVSSPPAAVEIMQTLSTTSPAPPMAEPDEEVPAMVDPAASESAAAASHQSTEVQIAEQQLPPSAAALFMEAEDQAQRVEEPGVAEVEPGSAEVGDAGGSDTGDGLADVTNETVPKTRSEQSESPSWERLHGGKANATNPFEVEDDITNPFAEDESGSELLAGIARVTTNDSTTAPAAHAAEIEPVQPAAEPKAQGWIKESVTEVQPVGNDRSGVHSSKKMEEEPADHLPPDEESVPDGPKKKVLKSVISSGEEDDAHKDVVKPNLQDGTTVEEVELDDGFSEPAPNKSTDAMSTAATKIQSFSRGFLARRFLQQEIMGSETTGQQEQTIFKLTEEAQEVTENGHSRHDQVATVSR